MAKVRSILVVVVMLFTTSVSSAVPVAAQDDGDAERSGSLAAQLLRAADASLGAEATVAVLRAYDRGYDVLQIVEALSEGLLATDGTIIDEDGAAVDPFLPPAGLIEGDPTASTSGVVSRFGPDASSGEAIALTALEVGVDRATTRLDKAVDLGPRVERAGASDDSMFTMLVVLTLVVKGYSQEQLLVDGFVEGGIRIRGPGLDPVIVDEDGKTLVPDGVERSPDVEDSAAVIEQLTSDIADLVAGVDPRSVVDERIARGFDVELEITAEGDGRSITITADGKLGTAKGKDFEGFVIGNAAGHVDAGGTCSIGDFIDESVPYDVTGTIDLGLAGRVDGERAELKAAVADAIIDVSVEGGDTICGDVVQETTEPALETVTVGPFDLRLRKGESATAEGAIGGEVPYTATITLS